MNVFWIISIVEPPGCLPAHYRIAVFGAIGIAASAVGTRGHLAKKPARTLIEVVSYRPLWSSKRWISLRNRTRSRG
jgi:hypothetical protein